MMVGNVGMIMNEAQHLASEMFMLDLVLNKR